MTCGSIADFETELCYIRRGDEYEISRRVTRSTAGQRDGGERACAIVIGL